MCKFSSYTFPCRYGSMKDASAAAVLDYLKAVAGVRDDSDLAKIIGYSKQAISTARKRGKVSLKMLAKASICFEKTVEEIQNCALAFEFAVDAGPAGKYAYPIFQLDAGVEKKNSADIHQPQAYTQHLESTEASATDDLPSRLVRLRNGRARRAFAEQMGTTESTLRNYEKGVSSPTAEFLRNICQILRVSPEWLLFGENSPESQGGQFSLPSVLTSMQACPDGNASIQACPGCAALERVLQLERAERQNLTRENAALREELAQLRERLKQSGGSDGTASVPMAHTA